MNARKRSERMKRYLHKSEHSSESCDNSCKKNNTVALLL